MFFHDNKILNPTLAPNWFTNVIVVGITTNPGIEGTGPLYQHNSEYTQNENKQFVGSMEAPSKAFLLFFLLLDWLKLNRLISRMECGFSDILSRHICSTVAETIGVINYAASFGAKNVQKTTFETAEMILGPWNQQEIKLSQDPFTQK